MCPSRARYIEITWPAPRPRDSEPRRVGACAPRPAYSLPRAVLLVGSMDRRASSARSTRWRRSDAHRGSGADVSPPHRLIPSISIEGGLLRVSHLLVLVHGRRAVPALCGSGPRVGCRRKQQHRRTRQDARCQDIRMKWRVLSRRRLIGGVPRRSRREQSACAAPSRDRILFTVLGQARAAAWCFLPSGSVGIYVRCVPSLFVAARLGHRRALDSRLHGSLRSEPRSGTKSRCMRRGPGQPKAEVPQGSTLQRPAHGGSAAASSTKPRVFRRGLPVALKLLRACRLPATPCKRLSLAVFRMRSRVGGRGGRACPLTSGRSARLGHLFCPDGNGGLWGGALIRVEPARATLYETLSWKPSRPARGSLPHSLSARLGDVFPSRGGLHCAGIVHVAS